MTIRWMGETIKNIKQHTQRGPDFKREKWNRVDPNDLGFGGPVKKQESRGSL